MEPPAVTGVEPSLKDSYRYAARITRSEARNFSYSFWFLTPERRRGISAVYAYSRRLDDCVDEALGGAIDARKAWKGLERLRSLLEGDCGDPLGPALQDTIRRFSIPLEPFHDLIAGMGMDLECTRYRTFEELRTYCYRVASTVGLICIEIFGNDGPAAREPAIDLGIAMQLTNILRDIPEDLARGRIYIPAEDLARFGYGEEDLRARVVSGAFRALMEYEVARAREYFRRSEPLLSHIQARSRRCPALLASFYRAILDRIEAAGYDVFRRRPCLPLHGKLFLAASQLIRRPRLSPRE